MFQLDNDKIIQSIVISTPCKMSWQDMQGDDKVRFCADCKLNVHNISSMNTAAALEVIERRKKERTCIFMYRNADGEIVVDNCPKLLKPLRQRINAWAVAMLISLTWCIVQSASAQGMIPAPIDPRYATGTAAGFFADCGYDAVRDWTRIATALSFAIAFFVPLAEHKKSNLKLVALELIALSAVPVLVYLSGSHFINNVGGLSGGGL